MLSLFKNRQKEKRAVDTSNQDRIAKMIVVKTIFLQRQWATFMQHHSRRLSRKWQSVILSLFCFCAGGCSIFLIAKSLTGNHTLSFRITQIKNSLFEKGRNEKVSNDEMITREQHEKIENFRRYMDSLARSPSGKILYKNILRSHPGLMDSLALFENIYQQQIKK